jgi:hypothetical protein
LEQAGRWEPWLGLGLLLLLFALIAWRYEPPAEVGTDALSAEFSGARAWGQLQKLIQERRPHPVGSDANAQVRERIQDRLASLGYTPEIQDTWACSADRACARVRNVVAVRPGRVDGPAVLVAAHYDSVGGGPGAGDDTAGVAAVLEMARALKGEPPARNPVVFLLDEGEEPGLIGAEAFVAEHPFARRVGAVVNLEARGTTGSSLMFETSKENGRLVGLFASAQSRPFANSIYYAIYKLYPNDTDLTVFKRHGYPGVNFAFLDNEVHYHTPLDDLAHIDPRSLQHLGQNALAMVRALSEADLDSLRAPEAVFFDVLTLGTVAFGEAWIRPLAVLGLVAVGAALVLAVRRRRLVSARKVAWGALAWLAAITGTAAIAAADALLLGKLGAFPTPMVAHPAPARLAFWAIGLAACIGAAGLFARRAGGWGLWLGGACGWAASGAVMAAMGPALAYPWVLPALWGGMLAIAASLPERLAERPPAWAWIPAFVLAALIWLPMVWLIGDALGAFSLAPEAVGLAFAVVSLAPVWQGDREDKLALVALGAVWIAGNVLALALPKYTTDSPQKLAIEYQLRADEAKPATAKWLALPLFGGLPSQLRQAADFSKERARALPWPRFVEGYEAAAPAVDIAPPRFTLDALESRDGGLFVRGRLASMRGAPEAGLVVPAGRVRRLAMNGKAIPQVPSKNAVGKLLADDPWESYACPTVGYETVELELELAGTGPVDAYVWDSSPGLPEEGKELVAARPKNAVTFQTGDRTLVYKPVRIGTANQRE